MAAFNPVSALLGGVLVGLASSLLMLFAGATVVHDQLGLLADRTATVIAALTLAVAHFYNSRLSLHSPARQAAG